MSGLEEPPAIQRDRGGLQTYSFVDEKNARFGLEKWRSCPLTYRCLEIVT